ncbi:uncharacterized protein LOC130928654 [Corythoichthys intestinalis]|uniref:uncharacterized protein LOC130928654 n=1 Tax=Corythoichthys intestinalis TaxID=161448 RepID=UPI0025A52C4C|nr:uncharacterized protein LOC130928654 [Corythoichthys intestinalis]
MDDSIPDIPCEFQDFINQINEQMVSQPDIPYELLDIVSGINNVNQVNNEMAFEQHNPDTLIDSDDPFVAIRSIDDFVDFFQPLQNALIQLNQPSNVPNESTDSVMHNDVQADTQEQTDSVMHNDVQADTQEQTDSVMHNDVQADTQEQTDSVMHNDVQADTQEQTDSVMHNDVQADTQEQTDSVMHNDVQADTQEQTDSDTQIGGASETVRPKFNNIELRQILTPSRVADSPDFVSFYNDIMENVQRQTDHVVAITQPGDIIQIEVVGDNVQQHVVLNATDDPEIILHGFHNVIDRLVQSNYQILCNTELEMVVNIVKDQRGGVRRKLTHMLDCEIVRKKRRYLYDPHPQNNQLCLAMALAYMLDKSLPTNALIQKARELHTAIGLSEQTAAGFADIHKFEQHLNRKIVVLYRPDDSDMPMKHFETDFVKNPNTLVLTLIQNHFYGVKSPAQFLGHAYFCYFCYKGHANANFHRCAFYCHLCKDPECRQRSVDYTKCTDCNNVCYNKICYAKHKEVVKTSHGEWGSRCSRYKKCEKCGQTFYVNMYKKARQHRCPVPKCQICRVPLVTANIVNDRHLCFIQTLKPQAPNQNIVFYDFETFLSNEGVHTAFLVCTKSFAGENKCFYGVDCCRQFILHFRQKKFENYIFVAHNARAFDAYLLISKMLDLGVGLSPIMQGSKIICFTETRYGLKFIDSLSFLMMKLSSMPKTLGYEDKMKGYFPHLFSSQENLNYVGPYPAPEFYSIDRMSEIEREKFLDWYRKECHGTFDFRKEALMYCQNDVDILAIGCRLFRDAFLKETDVDPLNSVTIASACMKVFRTKFLQADTLAIPSPDNYRRQHKSYSHASIQYLEWVSHDRGIFIEHALNTGERKVGGFFVDGHALGADGTIHVWEFDGCYFHGCPDCFEPSAICPMTQRPFRELHEANEEKLAALKSVPGVRLTIMKEHEWNKLKCENPAIREFLHNSDFPKPLDPREALFGGRTNAFVLRHTAGPDQKILYVDVTSLYPFVNASKKYAIGHPIIIHNNFEADVTKYFGFIRAKVYPPRKLYFPVLPYKTAKGKLVFTLCRTCAEINNQSDDCKHDDESRALTGVWVTLEMNKAVELGYRLARVMEVWHFEKTSSEVFEGYIKTFLKGKQEASGFPTNVVSQADKQKYICDYQANQGIQLDIDSIELNPGKRQVAKLCLNSLWGKFGQRSNLNQTHFVKKAAEFFKILFSGMYEIKYFGFINKDVAMIQYNFNKKNITPPSASSNVFVACMTTAHARLVMYEYLEKLQENVLYSDTDSLIYVVGPGEEPLPLGNYLGDLTDELANDSIEEFVSAGPKSYAYQTRQTKKTVIKVKGITQTYACSQRVNFDTIKDLVDGYVDHCGVGTPRTINTPQHIIVRDKKSFELRNKSFQKTFKVVYDKRRLLAGGKTLPFGY